jgi:sec-independent protein translocase protein TatB
VLDIGAGELLALAVVALLVLGPDKLPSYAADAAKFIRQIRRIANDARSEVKKELGPELEGLGLRDINPRALVRKHVLDGLDLNLEDDDEPEKPRRVNGSTSSTGSNGSTGPQRSADPASSGSRPAPFDPDTT